jgi:hypothetical protein
MTGTRDKNIFNVFVIPIIRACDKTYDKNIFYVFVAHYRNPRQKHYPIYPYFCVTGSPSRMLCAVVR